MSGGGKEKDVIKIGDVELSNSQLEDIVRQSASVCSGSEEIPELEQNEMFMKSLNIYADEKSKEIVEQTVVVQNASKQQKAAKAVRAAPPPPAKPVTARKIAVARRMPPSPPPPPARVSSPTTPPPDRPVILLAPPVPSRASKPINRRNKAQSGRFMNPNGADSAYFARPVDLDGAEFTRRNNERNQAGDEKMPLEMSDLFLKSPSEIARELCKEKFPYKFHFTLDIFFGVTGIVRQCRFQFSGQRTYDDIAYFFKHKYCESENYQWFYLNHDGNFFEVRDTLTLKQMLITHGAFPMGFSDTQRDTAKVLCIPRCVMTEDAIFEREVDLIMGFASSNARMCPEKNAKTVENMMFQLSPDRRFAQLFQNAVDYPLSEAEWEYNGQTFIMPLVSHCQRRLEVDELFDDPRLRVVTENDLLTQILGRYHCPLKNCSQKDSVRAELQSVLDNLRRSRHQTGEDYRYIEELLSKRAQNLR